MRDSSSTTTISYSFIFSPKYSFEDPYKYLWLELIHDDDYVKYVSNGTSYTGKFLAKDKVSVKFYRVNNLIASTDFGIASIKSGINSLTGITVDASPKWMFAVNGEEIKLGNSGRYELKDYDITSLGLIVKHTSGDSYE